MSTLKRSLSSIFIPIYKPIPLILWIICFFTLGIQWAYYSYSLFFIISFIIGSCLSFLYLFYQENNKDNYKKVFLYALVYLSFLAGAGRVCYHHSIYSHFNKKALNKHIYGDALIINYQENNNSNSTKFTKFKYNIILYFEHLKHYIKVYTHTLPEAQIGDIVYIKNIIIEKTNNPAINYYMQKEGIAAIVFVPHLNYTPIKASWSIKNSLYNLKNYLKKQLQAKLSGKTYALFCSIFLGINSHDKHIIKSLKSLFEHWGITHYLARSGLHIMLILALLLLIMRFIPLSYILKHIIVAIVIIIYTLLTWSSISFIRAFLTYCLYLLGIIRNIPLYPLHTFGIVCLINLLYNPLYLFALDFQLSFGLSLGLAWLNEIDRRKKLNLS